jgi:hypothetical protein
MPKAVFLKLCKIYSKISFGSKCPDHDFVQQNFKRFRKYMYESPVKNIF